MAEAVPRLPAVVVVISGMMMIRIGIRTGKRRIQVSLARLGAGFESASADIFQTESLRILAERLSQWEIGPPLRRVCHNPPLKKWGSSHTEINRPDKPTSPAQFIHVSQLSHLCYHTVMSLIQIPLFTSTAPITTLISSIDDTTAYIGRIGICV